MLEDPMQLHTIYEIVFREVAQFVWEIGVVACLEGSFMHLKIILPWSFQLFRDGPFHSAATHRRLLACLSTIVGQRTVGPEFRDVDSD